MSELSSPPEYKINSEEILDIEEVNERIDEVVDYRIEVLWKRHEEFLDIPDGIPFSKESFGDMVSFGVSHPMARESLQYQMMQGINNGYHNIAHTIDVILYSIFMGMHYVEKDCPDESEEEPDFHGEVPVEDMRYGGYPSPSSYLAKKRYANFCHLRITS